MVSCIDAEEAVDIILKTKNECSKHLGESRQAALDIIASQTSMANDPRVPADGRERYKQMANAYGDRVFTVIHAVTIEGFHPRFGSASLGPFP